MVVFVLVGTNHHDSNRCYGSCCHFHDSYPCQKRIDHNYCHSVGVEEVADFDIVVVVALDYLSSGSFWVETSSYYLSEKKSVVLIYVVVVEVSEICVVVVVVVEEETCYVSEKESALLFLVMIEIVFGMVSLSLNAKKSRKENQSQKTESELASFLMPPLPTILCNS